MIALIASSKFNGSNDADFAFGTNFDQRQARYQVRNGRQRMNGLTLQNWLNSARDLPRWKPDWSPEFDPRFFRPGREPGVQGFTIKDVDRLMEALGDDSG
jgi:hypothetical protein